MTRPRRLLVLGANNPETVRLVEAVNEREPTFTLVGFLDNDAAKHGSEFWGFPVLGGSALAGEPAYRDCLVVNAITRTPRVRKETTDELLRYGATLTNLIHPSVDTRHVILGRGVVVHEGTVLQPGARVGDNCAFNARVVVSHECVLGAHVFMAPGGVLAGLVEVGEGAMIGVHATVLPRLRIGAWATVGGGAVVVRDVPSGAVVSGNPAREHPAKGSDA